MWYLLTSARTCVTVLSLPQSKNTSSMQVLVKLFIIPMEFLTSFAAFLVDLASIDYFESLDWRRDHGELMLLTQ